MILCARVVIPRGFTCLWSVRMVLLLPMHGSASLLARLVHLLLTGPVEEKVAEDGFASIASNGQHTSSVGANPQIPVALTSSQMGPPLFWIGVGVGLLALFTWAAGRVKVNEEVNGLEAWSLRRILKLLCFHM